MPRFFCSNINTDTAFISSDDALHISRSLRMKKGDIITLCDANGFDYNCIITDFSDVITCRVIEKLPSQTEPDVHVTLFQALPKSDKLEFIIQKAVELGVHEIVPVITSRCVSRPDEKSAKKKLERYEKISLEAAKQAGRGIIPAISQTLTLKQAIEKISTLDIGIVCYEGGGKRFGEINFSHKKTMGILIGSEGGFDEDEVLQCEKSGIIKASLGPRILRCETAPIAVLSILMNTTKNM